jgi:hypothetical protein
MKQKSSHVFRWKALQHDLAAPLAVNVRNATGSNFGRGNVLWILIVEISTQKVKNEIFSSSKENTLHVRNMVNS